MKFIKPYDEVIAPITDPGNETEPVFMQRYDKDGRPYLEKVREENLVARIRSFKDSCSVESLIKKYVATGGDSSVLNVRKGIYADMTMLPDSLAEMYDLVHRASQVFDQMPDDIRALYNYSAAEFVADGGKKAMAAEDPVQSEVKANESDAQ